MLHFDRTEYAAYKLNRLADAASGIVPQRRTETIREYLTAVYAVAADIYILYTNQVIVY